MKKLLLFLTVMIAVVAIQAQTVIFSDNFDSYTAGQKLCSQNNVDWTTWSNAPGGDEDATIVTEQAASPANSLKITGSNDIIYRFANQTTGHYKVDMDYYVPTTGQGAYFNMQHYFAPGQQWAFECYFTNTGSGYLLAGSATQHTFSHPTNQWFHIIMDVNLDDDLASLTVNGVLVFSWPYHYQAGNTNGINQLGSINLYAGAPNNGTGTYYVDNFEVTEMSAANPGHIVITPDITEIHQTVNYQNGADYTLNLTNNGGSPVNYRIVKTFDIPTPNPASTGVSSLTYSPAVESGLTFTNLTEMQVANCFPAEVLTNHIGRSVRSVEVGFSSASNVIGQAKIRIYKMGNIVDNGPSSEILYEQAFTPIGDVPNETTLNTITFTTPFVIDGSDLWVACVYEQTLTNRAFVGVDDGTQLNENGDWYKNAVAWTHLSSGGNTQNWYFKVNVDGTPFTPWMTSTSALSGTLAPDANASYAIHFGSTAITNEVTYTGKIHVLSSELDNPEKIIPVTIDFTSSVDEHGNIIVKFFPNPAQESFTVEAPQAKNIEVYNVAGQLIYSNQNPETTTLIHSSHWTAGTYFVKVAYGNNVRTEKVIIK
ncbi:MAG: T9SS type A sorting domain-containing protein [Bacteroidales bacterium]|jgi:hypothetical protein|nr:T9SS type A sorting domain-containing protein [Bacteroidales bacterium]